MRRADRLFRLVQILRRGRTTTARDLARALEVSVRTVYRDVSDLGRSGVPIESEAGVGYRLRGYNLPPLMFSRDEVEALVLGARIVQTWTDEGLARSARSALEKVEAVLPAGLDRVVRELPIGAPPDHARAPITIDLVALRRSIRERRKVRFAYRDARDAATIRTVWPLGLAFYGPVWVLGAWCELRRDHRAFRPDRMSRLEVTDEGFEAEPGRTLRDFLCAVEGTEPTEAAEGGKGQA